MKTAIVVGSSRGIGKQIGIDLLRKGYFVFFNGRDENTLSELSKELAHRGYAAFGLIKADCSKIENIDSLLMEKVSVIVWNVGMTDRTSFGEITPKSWKEVFEANVDAPLFYLQAMKNNISLNGKIILISSILGIEPKSRSISYGVSKAAINMLVPYLAKEFSNKNITVNAVAPGFINTSWHEGKTEEQLKKIMNECLAERLGTVEEVSKVVMSIIDNDFINAQVIRVDGGYGL